MGDYRYTNRTIFDKVLEHKYIFIFTVLLFIFGIFLYITMADKVYRSDTTIEILPKNNLLDDIKTNPSQNSSYERYFQTQMEFLKSRYMVSKVVDRINLNVKLYEKGILNSYKVVQNQPTIKIKKFTIKDNSFYNRFFKIKVIDERSYSISLVSSNLVNERVSKPIICNFGEEITTKYMDFNIEKSRTLADNEYFLKVIPKYIEIERAIKKLKITRRSDKSSLMNISYDDNSPFLAKKFLDNLISIYTNILDKSQNSEIKNYQTVVDDELKKLKKRLDENEKKLLRFSEKNQVSGMTTQTTNIVNKIYKDEDQLAVVEQEYENIRSILIMIRRGESYKNLLTMISQIENKSLQSLVQSIIEEEKNYDTLKEKYRELHPKMQELKRAITRKKIVLKRNLVSLYKSTKSKKDELKRVIEEQKNTLTHLPSKEIGLSKLKREHDQLEKVYLSLLDKRAKLKISKKVNQDYMVKVVDSPYIPIKHIKPKGLILLMLATLLGSIFGGFFALIKDYFKKRVVTPEDIKEITSLPLLSTISKTKDSKYLNELFVLKEPESTASKMIWQLRGAIEHYKKDDECLVISVTSMIRGEGKTTITSNLATTLANRDDRVIILSLDLRLPQIHNKFGVKNRYGISNVMFESMNINNVIKKVKDIDNLYILPAGTKVQSPMKIINSKFMEQLLSELRKVFDYVLIDLAPISVAMESIFMMKQTDLNLFVVKSNYSEKEYLKNIENIAKSNDIKNIAYVLNAVDEKYINIVSRDENEKYIRQNKILDSVY